MKRFIIFWLILTPIVSLSQNYFQQKVDYQITVSLDPHTKTLKGFEKITYTNYSPDTLQYIYFHLYPNATRSKTKSALAKQLLYNNDYSLYFEKEENLGFIDSLSFKINQNDAKFIVLKDSIDIGLLYLNQPLLPNESITIETPFYVKIPVAGHTRMGYIGDIFGITQWYPKPAVYDLDGWHPYPYLENGEFYSDFGKYDVIITVPSEYTVAATGCLQNQDEWQRIDKIVNISKSTDDANIFYKKIRDINNFGLKTLHFIQDSIHDFAWFASPSFKIAHDSLKINHKIVHTWAYYMPYHDKQWRNAAQYIVQAVKYYSEEVGLYPYKHCTAVEMPYITEGGMEYPMITSVGLTHDTTDLFHIILHEVGHNWFYGILASDERKQPWIDEGINTFFELDYRNNCTKTYKSEWEQFYNMINQSIFPNLFLIDYFYFSSYGIPNGLKSEKYNDIEYYFNAYINTSSVFCFIKNYLGAETFTTKIKQLYQKKQFQHINSHDIKDEFDKTNPHFMDWYFYHYLKNLRRSDYKIFKVYSDDTSTTIKIKNKHKIDFPFSLHFYSPKLSLPLFENIQQGFSKGINTIIIHKKIDKGTKIVVNDHKSSLAFLESNYNNNLYHYRWLFPRLKNFSVRFAGIIDKQDSHDILFFPLAAFNTIDRSMIGLLLYAPPFPNPTFQFRFMPLYSIDKNRLNGSCFAEKNIPINQFIQNIKSSFLYQTYSLPENSTLTQWKNYNFKVETPFIIRKDLSRWNFLYTLDVNYSTLPFSPFNQELYINNKFSVYKQFNIYKTNINLNIENHRDYAKIKIDGHLFFPYNIRKKGIALDYFFGAFIFNQSRYYIYNLFLSGTNGIKDYTYNEIFVDRFVSNITHSIWQHQFVMNDGMFTTYTPIQSNKWLTSIRSSIAMPIPPPFYIYGTIGTYYQAKNAWYGSTQFPWEIGFEIRMIKNIFAVYFPIKMSSDITFLSNFIHGDQYLQKIRFTFRLSEINPFKFTNKLHTFF